MCSESDTILKYCTVAVTGYLHPSRCFEGSSAQFTILKLVTVCITVIEIIYPLLDTITKCKRLYFLKEVTDPD